MTLHVSVKIVRGTDAHSHIHPCLLIERLTDREYVFMYVSAGPRTGRRDTKTYKYRTPVVFFAYLSSSPHFLRY
ncbi:hypothetical protein D3C74_75090 [compost metagenome]